VVVLAAYDPKCGIMQIQDKVREMAISKISPCEAAVILKHKGVPYGKDYALPFDVDTSKCEQFGGTRCDCNIHVKSGNIAYRDRVDPRYDLVGHWEKDCGVSVGPLVLLGLGLLVLFAAGTSQD